jgi:hypothetical protein
MSPKERIQAKRSKLLVSNFDRQLENSKWYQARQSEINEMKSSKGFKKSFKQLQK